MFAAGHAEAGNDLPLLLSTTTAKRVDGGWTFTGRKAFGSLTPVWTRLGVHGMDVSNPSAPRIVHAFIPRGTPGVTIKETWDVLGMRATRSDDTVLENAFVPDKYVARVLPAGAGGMDAFVLGIFSSTAFNPLAAHARDQAERLYAEAFGRESTALGSKGAGPWLRQDGLDGQSILSAASARRRGTELTSVTAFVYDKGGSFTERIDATRATLQEGFWVLKEAVQFDRERVLTQTWLDYPILTFEEAPQVEVTVINRPDLPPLGAGEGTQGPTAAAVANAVFNAIGARLRDLPFTRDKVISALA